MVIEPTEEMIAEAMEAHNASGAYRPAVEAVLAIVARDYRLDRICREELMPGVHCAKPAHVKGDHEAKLPTGSAVSWS